MRAPRLSRIDFWDASLKLTGLALAGVSAVFATNMIMENAQPRITGVEHLAIYAKPATRLAARQRERFNAGIDDMPVGSIEKGQRSAALATYEILEASSDWALLRSPQGRVMRVQRGSAIAGLGGVIAIERRGSKWALVTESGVITSSP